MNKNENKKKILITMLKCFKAVLYTRNSEFLVSRTLEGPPSVCQSLSLPFSIIYFNIQRTIANTHVKYAN